MSLGETEIPRLAPKGEIRENNSLRGHAKIFLRDPGPGWLGLIPTIPAERGENRGMKKQSITGYDLFGIDSGLVANECTRRKNAQFFVKNKTK